MSRGSPREIPGHPFGGERRREFPRSSAVYKVHSSAIIVITRPVLLSEEVGC